MHCLARWAGVIFFHQSFLHCRREPCICELQSRHYHQSRNRCYRTLVSMNELKPTEAPAFPPSPNWFLSSIASCNSDGLLAFGARNDVYILDLRTQLVTRVLQGHTGRVTGTAFCDAQSGIVASCSADQSIILWNTSNGSIVEKVKEHSVRIFGPPTLSIVQNTDVDVFAHRQRSLALPHLLIVLNSWLVEIRAVNALSGPQGRPH